MKRAVTTVIKVFLGIIILIFVLLFTFPVFFKNKIKTKVEQVINESVNAKVSFADYRLGFFRNFPNLTFSLNDISVVGIEKFQNDTLVSVKSVKFAFNLSSLFKKTGYEIISIVADEAAVNAIVLEDGSVNWDIIKETDEVSDEEVSTDIKIFLKKVAILNSSISYIDFESSIEAYLESVSSDISGDMTLSETDLRIAVNAGELTYIMDGIKYLNKAAAYSEMDLLANLDCMKFTFRENFLTINELKVHFSGWVAMPEDDIITDLTFKAGQTEFKSLLSIIPAIYMTEYGGLKTSGEFSFSGSAKGVYSDSDSTMPDISLSLKVNNGSISYPSLPEQIKNIYIVSDIFVDGKEMDRTTVDVNSFHMELAGNPFDVTFTLKTPVSDPDVKGSMVGRIDLSALSKAVPLDSISLSGIIDMSVTIAGRLSMLEKEQYQSFKASGNMDIKEMLVVMTGYPAVKITEAGFEFTPAYAILNAANITVGGKSDFFLSGRLENYIPYVFKDDVVRGNLTLRSKLVDMGDIMSAIVTDTSADDTTSLAVIKVPENISFDFNAFVDQFNYNNINARNVRGNVIVKDGILRLKDTGMDILGGKVIMNADYDTREILRPVLSADLSIESLGIKDAFNTFNTIQKLAPASKGIDGKMSLKLNYNSLLGSNLMPLIHTIDGGGRVMSNEVTLIESVSYNRMKEVLKLGERYTNTFKDLNISFKINGGRVYVTPFNTKAGNIRMNIGGDQGIDQTINYVVKAEIPRADLGNSANSLIDNLSSQAAAIGIPFKPSDIIKVNLKISGTFLKPSVTTFFGDTPSESPALPREAVREIVQSAIDTTVSKVKDKVRSETEIQGDKLMEEAEKRAQQIRDEAAKIAEKIRREADVRSQKITMEAESKGTIAKLAAQRSAESIKKEADKRAEQVIREGDEKAAIFIDEAKLKREELLNKF